MSSQQSSTALADAWARQSEHLLDGALAINRAVLDAFGLPATVSGAGVDATGDATTPAGNGTASTGGATAATVEPGMDHGEWEIEVSAGERDALGVGDRVRFTKTVTDADVRRFAAASGDTNPVHLDPEFAGEARFGERIVHGTLVSGLISAALARLPGGVIYLSQDVEFLEPVAIGDRLTADCEIVEELGGDQYRLLTRIIDGGTTVVDGEAVVLIDELP
ncbi:acyl dehydratase [Halobacteriales archaeon QS_4_69_34]|nr:MAG: acyl dehydratase [Halobacteriales archaeon QS_4_69_34]